MNVKHSQPDSVNVCQAIREPDGQWWIGGVFAGRRVCAGLFAEAVASHRFMIRSTRADPSFAQRLGEVFGGQGRFQAVTVRGDHVGMAKSLVEAAEILAACGTVTSKVTSQSTKVAACAEH